jgi:4-hydroxy-4-methyl-2-oxoglutarate aldolase
MTATDALVARLARLETGQVSDVLDEAGLPNQVLASSLFALAPGARFAGRAACLRGEPIISAKHVVPALPPEALEQAATPGSVIVMATGGFVAGACIGGFVAYSLKREGAVGFVTDGAVRDADEIRELGFPVVTGAVTPTNGARRWRLVEAGRPVTLPGQTGVPVVVNPGDLILADGDGVVVVPADGAEQIIADSEELQRIERAIGEGLRAGGTRPAVFKANPRFAHIRPR